MRARRWVAGLVMLAGVIPLIAPAQTRSDRPDPAARQSSARPLHATNLLVVPRTLEKRDIYFGGQTLAQAGRSQQVYAASEFPPHAILITELRFRPNMDGWAFSASIANLEVRLSTTSKSPRELELEFARNTGSDETLVYSGVLNISSAFKGPDEGPKEFDIFLPLKTPFTYDPSRGNLLLDIRNHSGAHVPGLSGLSEPNTIVRRAATVEVDGTHAEFTDHGAEVLQIVYALAQTAGGTNAPTGPDGPLERRK
jgi:hypothetical protein